MFYCLGNHKSEASHRALLPSSVSFQNYSQFHKHDPLCSFLAINFSVHVCVQAYVYCSYPSLSQSPSSQFPHSSRYDSEGRLTNVTYPTGMVTSLHREIERSINIDIESSNRDDDVTVITNLSSVEASYTVVQGRDSVRKCSAWKL